MSPSERIEVRLRALYGDSPGEVGTLHVAAVWREPSGGLRVMRIRPGTPRSDTDAFVLSVARARADVILTSGRILREEPDLTHGLLGPEAEREGLRAWRRQRLGRAEPARSAVLTRGAGLDLDHPLFRAEPRPLLLVPAGAPPAPWQPLAEKRGIEIVALDPAGPRTALAALRARGARCISVEAGPATALDLYASPLAIDELMLSVFEGETLPAGVAGEVFLEPARLRLLLPHASRPRRELEPSGPWSFERRWR